MAQGASRRPPGELKELEDAKARMRAAVGEEWAAAAASPTAEKAFLPALLASDDTADAAGLAGVEGAAAAPPLPPVTRDNFGKLGMDALRALHEFGRFAEQDRSSSSRGRPALTAVRSQMCVRERDHHRKSLIEPPRLSPKTSLHALMPDAF